MSRDRSIEVSINDIPNIPGNAVKEFLLYSRAMTDLSLSYLTPTIVQARLNLIHMVTKQY